MPSLMKRAPAPALLLALPFVLIPGTANAQEQEAAEQEQCIARAVPESVEPAQALARLTFVLSQDIGEVSGVKAPDESGLTVATPEELERVTLTWEEETETPEPIETSHEGNAVDVWLNTTNASPGVYRVVLEGEEGECTAEVTVKAPPEAEEEGEEEPEPPAGG